jgi:vacuolar-type H+-ATPase subunit I/STV1
MTRRAILFVGWAVLGMVASYGALYAFTPFGIAILAVCALVAWPLPKDLELIGAASAIVVAAFGAYLLAGRARCARSA